MARWNSPIRLIFEKMRANFFFFLIFYFVFMSIKYIKSCRMYDIRKSCRYLPKVVATIMLIYYYLSVMKLNFVTNMFLIKNLGNHASLPLR
jgi:hypothetical protein